MAAYLSAAWFEEVNAAARADEALAAATAGARVTLQQVVTGAPGGEVAYWVRVDDGVVDAGLGRADRPDATLTSSYATAVAVSRGELALDQALREGRVRLAGDVGALLGSAAALGGMAGAFAEVRDRTTYG
ncbi:MAG: SCP2 sterol-binding domain-containing protein [Acidimicrobiales bacterium]